jgi:SAM-dependent methyltransferase
MNKFWSKLSELETHWVEPILPIRKWIPFLRAMPGYMHAWHHYEHMSRQKLYLSDSYPCLFDMTQITSFEPHYFYQAVWASRCISNTKPVCHVDIGSQVQFVGMLAAFIPVTFVDIRPLQINVPNLTSISGSLLNLPFASSSIDSLSCLHVVEHVGLGRYRDPLDPQGTLKAVRELSRVLAQSGHLYISIPIGQPRICFNAHRIHSPDQIIEYLSDLELVEFSVEDDRGTLLLIDTQPELVSKSIYACGLFHFRKPKR